MLVHHFNKQCKKLDRSNDNNNHIYNNNNDDDDDDDDNNSNDDNLERDCLVKTFFFCKGLWT